MAAEVFTQGSAKGKAAKMLCRDRSWLTCLTETCSYHLGVL